MAKTRAQQNRAIRQEALRKQLAEQCRLQHVLDNIKQMEELDPTIEGNNLKIQALKQATELRLKLVAKYLGDAKAPQDINLGGQEGNPIESKMWTVEPVKPVDDKSSKG